VGCAQAYCGDAAQSLATLRRAVDAAPFDFGAWGYMGWPLTASGKPEHLQELLDICDRLLENAAGHPGSPYWHYHRSVALACQQKPEAAVQPIENYLALQPEFALGCLHYANVLGQLQKNDEAVEWVRKSVQANPKLTPKVYELIITRLSNNPTVQELRLSGLRAAGLLG